jgi:hypothetical protein
MGWSTNQQIRTIESETTDVNRILRWQKQATELRYDAARYGGTGTPGMAMLFRLHSQEWLCHGLLRRLNISSEAQFKPTATLPALRLDDGCATLHWRLQFITWKFRKSCCNRRGCYNPNLFAINSKRVGISAHDE